MYHWLVSKNRFLLGSLLVAFDDEVCDSELAAVYSDLGTLLNMRSNTKNGVVVHNDAEKALTYHLKSTVALDYGPRMNRDESLGLALCTYLQNVARAYSDLGDYGEGIEYVTRLVALTDSFISNCGVDMEEEESDVFLPKKAMWSKTSRECKVRGMTNGGSHPPPKVLQYQILAW